VSELPDDSSSDSPPRLDYAPEAEGRPALHLCAGAVATAAVILPLTVVGALFGGMPGLIVGLLFPIAIAALATTCAGHSARARGRPGSGSGSASPS
jgi:hypothetical protein